MALIFMVLLIPGQAHALISIANLDIEKAGELGVTLHQRPNGEAGVLVWIEITNQELVGKYTYCEFRLAGPDGKHMASAKLELRPVRHGQAEDIHTYAFSVAPEYLKDAQFMLVTYQSSRGHVGYLMKVKDFLPADGDPARPAAGTP